MLLYFELATGPAAPSLWLAPGSMMAPQAVFNDFARAETKLSLNELVKARVKTGSWRLVVISFVSKFMSPFISKPLQKVINSAMLAFSFLSSSLTKIVVVAAASVVGRVGTNKMDVIPMVKWIEANSEGDMSAGVMTARLMRGA